MAKPWYPDISLQMFLWRYFLDEINIKWVNLKQITLHWDSQVAQRWRSACQGRGRKRHGFDPCVGKIPWRRKQQPTPAFSSGKSRGQRSLVGCSPRGLQQVRDDWMTERAHTHTPSIIWVGLTQLAKGLNLKPDWPPWERRGCARTLDGNCSSPLGLHPAGRPGRLGACQAFPVMQSNSWRQISLSLSLNVYFLVVLLPWRTLVRCLYQRSAFWHS